MANQIEKKHSYQIKIENERMFLSGEIDFDNCVQLYQSGLTYFSSTLSTFIVDFSNVQESNSAAIAVMVEWIKYIKSFNKKIQFLSLPASITTLIELARMDSLIK